MFASRRGSISAPVIEHGKFVLSFYSILMCACKETDVRESPSDSTPSGWEGQGSRGETFHMIYGESPVSSMAEHPLHSIADKFFRAFRTLCESASKTAIPIFYEVGSK
jgi:hypothetical protein